MARKQKEQDDELLQDLPKKKREKKRRFRNKEMWFITYAFVLLMLAVIAHEAYFVYNDSETVINNSYNSRQSILASRNIRGSILSADGEYLAVTVQTEEGEEKRVYPYSNLFAHVVGYSTKGKTGIEYLGNLAMLTSNASFGEKLQNELNSEKNIGDNVVTTLNTTVQQVAYDALGAYDGAIIVSEPSTGKIIAMVSKPDFDPNTIAEMWDTYVNDSTSSVLLNRATQGLYPPGSTFKIITALEYYREHQGDVSSYSFTCSGSYTYSGSRISCYHGSNHGSVSFLKSFAKSCNSSFAYIGLSLDLDSLASTCESLMFNQSLGLDYTTGKSSYVLTSDAEVYDIMQTAIGQGQTTVTPLLMNMITCAIANGGEVMTPYLIDRIENYSGTVIKQYEPETYATFMTEDEADFLTTLMEEVVNTGTATKLNSLSYTVAGKTGSAEYSSDSDDSHAWFTGFAPADDPQVCVTIIVEGAGSGGEYAVPMAKRIFEAYFSTQ